MKWEIKHGFRQDTLFNAAHEKTMAIRRKAGTYLIIDALGQAIYRLGHETPLTIRIHGADEGFARMKLAEGSSIFIPPKAENMEVSLSNAVIMLYQTQKRDFVISRNEEKIGVITGILRISTQVEISDAFPADSVALLYSLALFMLHEDDIDIV